jgi:methionyl-tRNA synthetase
MITIEEFKKVEIKIARVKSVEKVEDADKLLKIIFDLGDEERQIIAGMAESFEDPSVLVGKQLPIIANLEPKMLRGYESQGMVLAVDVDGKATMLHPAEEVPCGSTVR